MESPQTSMAERKRELRSQFRLRRRRLLEHGEAGVQTAVAACLPELLRGGAGAPGWLGLYWPLPGEVDLRPVLRAAGDGRHQLAWPAIAGGALRFRPWLPDSRLRPDDCGIPAPADEAGDLRATDLRLLLVPALAVDRRGIRLGYGGGWYDRLRSGDDWRAVPALAVLPQGCLADGLPREPWDVPLDGWLTEAGLTLLAPRDEA